MRDQPTGTDLILAARKVLVDAVMPAVSDELRQELRMVTRALHIAGREIEAGDWPLRKALERLQKIFGKDLAAEFDFIESTPGAIQRVMAEVTAQLSQRIRAGEFDSSSSTRDEVREHLLAVTLDKLREDDPRYLEAQGFDLDDLSKREEVSAEEKPDKKKA